MTPVVAIVGRPNVGKSTLFNRLARRSLAIVHNAPGVTRDRKYAAAHLAGREVVLVDTGGFDPQNADPLSQNIAQQVALAVEEADVVLCVLDGSAPPTPVDHETVELLRRSRRPVLYLANKLDQTRDAGMDLYSLGIPELHPVSALHGRGTGELAAQVSKLVSRFEPSQNDASHEDEPRVAVIGRPNAGKSSLVNRLIGVERSLVDERPGTTHDPVDSRVVWKEEPFVLVDTAGIRRRSRVDAGVEAASVLRALRAMGRAEVVVLLCDATQGISEQDTRLLGLCCERQRAALVALNKVDLLSNRARRLLAEQSQEQLGFARWVPIVEVSAKTGHGLSQLVAAVVAAAHEYRRRVPTSQLNQFFERALERHPPPTRGGRAPRIYYITQAETRPPVFVAMTSAPGSISQSYQRFVTNQIRKAFGFQAVPLVVHYRKRSRRSD